MNQNERNRKYITINSDNKQEVVFLWFLILFCFVLFLERTSYVSKSLDGLFRADYLRSAGDFV